jgi:hypothetical protein
MPITTITHECLSDNRELTIKVLVENIVRNSGGSYDSDWDFKGYTDFDFDIIEAIEVIDNEEYLVMTECLLVDDDYDKIADQIEEMIEQGELED